MIQMSFYDQALSNMAREAWQKVYDVSKLKNWTEKIGQPCETPYFANGKKSFPILCGFA